MPILISKTYEVVTEKSAAIGEAAEHGFVFEDVRYGFRELVKELKDGGYIHKSESHGVPRWVSTEADLDMATGDETIYSLHPGYGAHNQRYWEKACRAAGLIQ